MQIAKFTITFILGISLGFVFGFRSAPFEYASWSSQFDAVMLTRELTQLRAGEYNRLIESKESDLNFKMYWHGVYLDSRLGFLLPHGGGKVNQKTMEEVVAYRKTHPYILVDLSESPIYKNDSDPEFLDKLHKGYENQKTQIEKVLNLYAK